MQVANMSSPSSKRHHHVDLPTEVLYEIFFRLPSLKPVYRFRCVSKFWNSLLTEPSFINKTYNRLTSVPWIYLYDPSDVQVQLYLHRHHGFIQHHDGLSFDFLLESDLFKTFEIEKLRFLDSCSNGLVLLAEPTAVYQDSRKTRFYIICNPLTKQWEVLPCRQDNDSQKFYVNTKLVCDTSTAASLSDHSICNYKVVYINFDTQSYSLQVFSPDTGKWKTFELPRLEKIWYCFSGMAIRHGVLYWTGTIPSSGTDEEILTVIAYSLENKNSGFDQYRLISYNINGTCIRNCDVPINIKRSFFGESEGSIFYGHIFSKLDIHNPLPPQRLDTFKVFLNVWQLEDDYTNGGLSLQMVCTNIELKGYLSSKIEALYINPVDRNVIIIVDRGCCLAYDIKTLTHEVLRGCPVPKKMQVHEYLPPILITPKPTVLPLVNR